MELFYSSGIRREEMARLAVQDVDIKNGFVRVSGARAAKTAWCPSARARAMRWPGI